MLKAITILDKILAGKTVTEDWIIEAQRELLELQHDTSRKEAIRPVCPKCGSEKFITSTFLYTTEECRECGYYYTEGLE